MEFKDIIAAKKRIAKYIRNTPLDKSVFLSKICDCDVFLKLENLQLTGSFKIRGALNKILGLSQKEKEMGLVTASSGNHAQGVGYAAKLLGINALILVPTYTPKVKIEAIRRLGVDLIVYGDEYLKSEAKAREYEREKDMTYISAYNDSEIISGQGTIGIEMLKDSPSLDAIFVPVGGGGLISGIGCAIKTFNSSIKVIGAQSVASPVMYESLKKGRIVEVPLKESVADGLHGGIEKGSITFDLCKRYVDEIVIVEEESVIEALRLIIYKQRQIIEGSSAVGIAALLKERDKYQGLNVGVVVSGGNIDEVLLRKVLQKV